MKTRTLLLLALACGLAIMLAGAALFVRLAAQADLAPAAQIGQTVKVGDMSVAVTDAAEADGVLSISITAEGVAADITDDFRLIASGRRVDPMPDSCVARETEPVDCELRFDVSSADGTSRMLFVDRGDQQQRWVVSS